MLMAFRKILISATGIFLALCASTLLMFILFLGVNLFSGIRNIPDLNLPAQNILVLVHYPTTENYRYLSQWFPQFEKLPINTVYTCLIKTPQGSLEPVLIYEKTKNIPEENSLKPPAEGSWKEISFKQFTVFAPAPAAEILVSSDSANLLQQDWYREIKKEAEKEDLSWTYLYLPAVDFSQNPLDSFLAGLSPYAGMIIKKNKSTFLFYKKDIENIARKSSDPVVLSGTYLEIRASQPTAFWSKALSLLSESDRLGAEGRIRELTKQVLGKDIDLFYDLIPDKDNPASLTLLKDSGGDYFIFEKKIKNINDQNKFLQRLQSSFSGKDKKSKLVTIPLEDRTLQYITEDIARLAEKKLAGNWQIFTQTLSDNQTLAAAVRDGDIIISNNQILLEAYIAAKNKAVSSGFHAASGFLNPPVAENHLQRHSPFFTDLFESSLLAQPANGFVWLADYNRPVLLVRLLPPDDFKFY